MLSMCRVFIRTPLCYVTQNKARAGRDDGSSATNKFQSGANKREDRQMGAGEREGMEAINSWGMRARECCRGKAPGTSRVVLLMRDRLPGKGAAPARLRHAAPAGPTKFQKPALLPECVTPCIASPARQDLHNQRRNADAMKIALLACCVAVCVLAAAANYRCYPTYECQYTYTDPTTSSKYVYDFSSLCSETDYVLTDATQHVYYANICGTTSHHCAPGEFLWSVLRW